MTIETMYVACDGTKFYDEDECLAHEASLTEECEFVKLYNFDGAPIKWNPDNYDNMWSILYYIVIDPHREEEAEEWWNKTFRAMLSVSPFNELDDEWRAWKYHDHGDEPTVLVFDFQGNDSWSIFNTIYDEIKSVVRGLGLVDALG